MFSQSVAAPSYQPLVPAYQPLSWDHQAMINNAPSYGSAFPANAPDVWFMDSGATSHVTGNPGTLTSYHSPLELNSQHIIIGDGSRLPIVAAGTAHLTNRPFYLNNVLVSPQIVKNLISIRKFSRENSCSIEFDLFGFSVKDLATRSILMRPNSSGDL
jgi:hypothetical protein